MSVTLASKIALWLGALSLAVISGLFALNTIQDSPDPDVLVDDAVVWCDANRALVALSAETLGLLPDDLVQQPLDIEADDSDAPTDLSDETALESFRLLRELASQAPPQQYGDLGYRTAEGFEDLALLGPRSAADAADITKVWVDSDDAGWDRPQVRRACLAAFAAFESS